MEKNINDIYYNPHDGSNSEELHTLPARDKPTVNMEKSLINQSEDDDHSG